MINNNIYKPNIGYASIPGSTRPNQSGGTGFNLDREKLIRALPIILALAAGGKGTRGIAAGAAAGTTNTLMQQEEERQRYEEEQAMRQEQYANEQRRQAWQDQIVKDQLAREEETRKYQQQTAGFVGSELGTMAAGTPETAATSGQTYAWNQSGYAANPSTPEGQAATFMKQGGYLPQNVAPVAAAPGTSGDPMAKMWADILKQSGGAEWALNGALQYYQASKQPQGARRSADLFSSFSKKNKSAAYALTNYGTLNNEELDKWYRDAIAEEAALRGEGLDWAKLKQDAGSTATDTGQRTYTEEELTNIIGKSKSPYLIDKNTGLAKLGSFEGAMYNAIAAGNKELIFALSVRWNKLHPKDQRLPSSWYAWVQGFQPAG